MCSTDLVNFLAFASKEAAHGPLVRRGDMIKFELAHKNAERIVEIDNRLKKLDAEMSSPNIKEIKHQELAVLYRQLEKERASLSTR